MPKEEIIKLIESHWWNLGPNYTNDELKCSVEVNRTLELLIEEVKKK